MRRSLIVGFGRAGRGLHHHCLRKAMELETCSGLFDQCIGVVDPMIREIGIDDSKLNLFSEWEQAAARFEPEHTVVHICTPPILHVPVLRQAIGHGYRKIIMEKPLTTSLSELEVLQELQSKHCFDVLVVANWLSSSLTKKIQCLIQSGELGPLREIRAEQNKPRLTRTLANASHGNAFDIEIPHIVALALALGGKNAEVLDAEASDMRIGEQVFPSMGSAKMTLRHAGGITSQLGSNLASPIRERVVRLFFDNQIVCGYFPSGGDDSYSWLRVYSSSGILLDEQIVYDDPLTAVFEDFYRYYNGEGPKPMSDIHFNACVVKIISQAKALYGLPEADNREPIPASAP